jgi:hypothetical protein
VIKLNGLVDKFVARSYNVKSTFVRKLVCTNFNLAVYVGASYGTS